MSVLFSGSTRDELRRIYLDAWDKHRQNRPLTPLESMIVEVIAMHPEYQALLADPDAALSPDSHDAAGGHSPFLHLGLHMALREQLSIDRPPGICSVYRSLTAKLIDPHLAEHRMLEVLAQTLWDSRQAGLAANPTRYLERLQSLAASSPPILNNRSS
jgi:Domain of unknown function (DUF1841)